MKFSLLLYVLYIKLRLAAGRDARFAEFIRNKTLSVLIKTRDDVRGRLYVFDRGCLTSASGCVHDFDTAMVWSDAALAFSAMSSPDEEVSLAALTQGNLVIEGNYKDFAWFSRALAIMMGKP